MTEVILTDGTRLRADVGLSGTRAIWIWMRDASDPNNDLARLTQVLSQPGATHEITRIKDGQSKTYTGYVMLRNVKYYQGDLVCARLERSVQNV